MFLRHWQVKFKIIYAGVLRALFFLCNLVAKNELALHKIPIMKYALLFLFALVAFSCKKSDLIPPTSSVVTVNDISNEILEFSPGTTFTVRSTISDNVSLGQFKIDIHQDFDGHSHKTSTQRYSEIRIKNIDGTNFALEESFTIPENASSGTYHGTLTSLDDEGNVSDVSTFYFNIIQPTQPTISMNLPSSISNNEVLSVLGVINAQGDATLSKVRIRIRGSNSGNTLLNGTYTMPPTTTTWNPFENGNVSLTIPQEENGKLFFRLWVEDSNGNNTIFETEIIIV
jgi:hypothetical protein